jgi:hypothetical protein
MVLSILQVKNKSLAGLILTELMAYICATTDSRSLYWSIEDQHFRCASRLLLIRLFEIGSYASENTESLWA